MTYESKAASRTHATTPGASLCAPESGAESALVLPAWDDPCSALRGDLDEMEERADSELLADGVQLVTVLRRLAALPRVQRAAYAAHAAPVWERFARRDGSYVDRTIFGAPSVTTLARWTPGSPTLAQVRALLEALERVESEGGLRLASEGLHALLALVPPTDLRAGYVLAQEGRVRRTVGDLSGALACFERARVIAEHGNDAWLTGRVALGRGVVLTQRGNYPEARRSFELALRLSETIPEFRLGAHHALAQVAYGAGDYAAALTHDREAFRAAKDAAQRSATLLSLGSLCRRLGRYVAAANALTAALALHPPPRIAIVVHRNLMLSLIGVGDLTGAREQGERLHDLITHSGDRFEDVRAVHALGHLHRAEGEMERAREQYAKAAEWARAYEFAELRLIAEDALDELATSAGSQSMAGSKPTSAADGERGRECADAAMPAADLHIELDARSDHVVQWLATLPAKREALLLHV